MHVLYYHQHFSTRAGAAGTRSFEFSRRLIARGHRVTMVCGSYAQGETGVRGEYQHGGRRGSVEGIDVIEFELPYSNRDGLMRRTVTFLKYAVRSTWIALSTDCDLVFATTTPLTAGLPGIAARWLRGKPFVFEVRDLWPELPRAMGVITNPVVLWALSLLEWLSYRSASRCIGLSPGIVDGICRRGVSRSRVALVPNGCDLDLFASSAVVPSIRDDLQPTGLVAIYAGTHGVANGLDAVLNAAAELRRRGRQDIKIVFVGEGERKSGLVTRATREGLDNCMFHAPLPKTQLAGFMKQADVGLMILANVPAFYYGTSPNKFFDYLAAGIPVLTNYPGWVADMIAEADCGLAIQPDNPIAFADALEMLALSRERRSAMGAHGRALAEAQFDRDRLAEKWSELLEQLVDG